MDLFCGGGAGGGEGIHNYELKGSSGFMWGYQICFILPMEGQIYDPA